MWQRQKKCSSEDEEGGVAGCRHRSDSKQATYEQAVIKQTLAEQSGWQDEYTEDIALFRRLKESLGGYFLLSIYLALLIIPVYAIVMSAMKQDWLMMVIDTLLIPVGFIHGLLMLFGVV